MAAACPKRIKAMQDSGCLAVATNGSRWYALQVRQRYEKITSSILKNKGYCEFSPLYQARRRWSDRIALVDIPLFPGYVFCRFDAQDRQVPVVTTPGVIRIVGIGAVPTPVDDAEIQAIQSVIQSGASAEPWPYMQSGDTVRIEHGPLAGMDGFLVERKTGHRLVLSITLLQRSVAVEVDAAFVALVRRAASTADRVCQSRQPDRRMSRIQNGRI